MEKSKAAKNIAVACPPLPAGPIDVAELDKALQAGKSAEEAIAAASASNPVPEEVKPAPVAETAAPKAAPETSKE